MRLLLLIKDDKYVDLENVMALNVMRLYLNKMRSEMVQFLKIGSHMARSFKSKDNSTNGILNLLEISHIIFIYVTE